MLFGGLLKALVRKNRLAFLGLVIVAALVVMAVGAPLLAPKEPTRVQMSLQLLAPNAVNWLGTDVYGRDILSRVVWGARTSLLAGLSAVLLSTAIGVPLGAISGYAGGKVDELIMRGMDVMLAFPALILAMAISASIGSGITGAILAVGVVGVPRYVRIVRGSTLVVRETEFIEAARAAGARGGRIILRHILPNVLSPVVVQLTLGLGQAILITASLSFIGLGVHPPIPEWGSMVSEGRDSIVTGQWWTTVFPGMAIMAAVVGFNLFGDGLQDFLDPRIRRG